NSSITNNDNAHLDLDILMSWKALIWLIAIFLYQPKTMVLPCKPLYIKIFGNY
ncbi:hypothetical protein ACJX0J_007286, partial [Zea mays]